MCVLIFYDANASCTGLDLISYSSEDFWGNKSQSH